MADSQPAPGSRTRIVRHPERGSYDRDTACAILDEALVCHVGFATDGGPMVIPTLFARLDDTIYIHGSAIGRMLTTLAGGVDVCVTVTLVDGLVLARSAFHHSMNYRSVVVLGRAREVTDPDQKWRALEATVNHVLAKRWDAVRQPSDAELRATTVVALPIEEYSVKIRAAGVVDSESDYGLDTWAGVLPLAVTAGEPEPDARLTPGIDVPADVRGYRRA